VWERLLVPVTPQTPYPGSADGQLPAACSHAWDPLTVLGAVASRTSRVALGTSVLDIPYYNPVVLARALTTLDHLSSGRVRVGLGVGWSKFLEVLRAVWTTDPVEFQGRFYQIPRSVIGLKPVQKPHPPVFLATYVPAGLERIGRRADGWNPVGMPVEAMTAMTARMREAAKAAGRDPGRLEVIVRANVAVTPKPLGGDRPIFWGTTEQVKEDVAGVREMGAAELFFDPTVCGVVSPERYLTLMENLRTLVGA
jgi:alkanesulfonate monooxygenase SsuD/methylene tetrahydromethanopterin reductase-like flavin-dependent oxidoreductase (luciferase family)